MLSHACLDKILPSRSGYDWDTIEFAGYDFTVAGVIRLTFNWELHT
ncbi:MAG: hypothetical protein M2R45_03229 [Verrucomicrobia subdivision 3 bacterium]|nr:hypothetical protein [Limisphaerales bacterium]MCS1416090.1 hypothetical protein [Limisphaerales bacterium]